MYQRAESDRALWLLWIHGLLGALVLTGLVVAWYFTRLLARSYRKEQEALQISQNAVAVRDDLMGIVAHDLRNPLSVISMKAAVLRAVSDSESIRSQADSIEKIATHMAYLIETMLDVATLEAGRLSVTPTSCSVEHLLSDAAEMFGNVSASRRIRLVRIPTEAELAVQADRRRILQVLSNLLGNALKFTPDGGEVRLSAIRHGRTMRIAVCDTGPGIAASHLPRIFDRFWKHEAGGKQGTGLGLFITKGIVDAHRGQIWVESEPNQGAAFYFTLPLADSKGFTASASENGERRASVG